MFEIKTIYYFMSLNDVKINTICIIKSINIKDEKIKIRLMELGLNIGSKIVIKNKSLLKKTLLIVINSCCFTLKSNLAKGITVHYA